MTAYGLGESTAQFLAQNLYRQRFNPGAEPDGDEWRDFLAHVVPGKAEADYLVSDWRAVQNVMRRYLPPTGAVVDPCPYLQWYGDAHGVPVE